MLTATIFRVVIFVLIAGAIFLGARRIWRDWRGEFRRVDKVRHERDVRERAQPGVITLERGKDGKYRPPGDSER